MKKITILGSTGSIGTQCLDVIRKNPQDFQVVGLTCGKNIELLKEQIREFRPDFVVVGNEEYSLDIKKEYPKLEVYFGSEGLKTAAEIPTDLLFNSIMGMRGLEPTLRAIETKKNIALANKETLVAGGELVMEAVKRNGVKLIPVDSEHSAIFQSLEGNENRKIKKILLTCSGGPFRGKDKEFLKNVQLEDALKHPKWNMGKKITIDSATLMNKGLEVIEAKWLFNVKPEDIQVLVHPQSILHSAVEYEDGSVIGQMGKPDMRIPISLALGYPNRIKSDEESLNFFTDGKKLTFEKPDLETFRALKLAYEAIDSGGSYPIVLNGANEELVELFLQGKIRFSEITDTVEEMLNKHDAKYNLTLEDILSIDRSVRREIREKF